MKILLTGGTGFIGQPLVERLLQRGDTVTVYTRNASLQGGERLDYVTDLDEIPASSGFDAFINLAGESIAGGRWTEARKQELLDSRVGTTRMLHDLASRLESPPATLLSASAIGYYGPQGDMPLDEEADTIDCFSHRLCVAWEEEAHRFESLGSRVCIMRLGVVLAADGGAFEQLKRSVQFGVATWLGSGEQWLSWVHRDDVLRAVEFLLDHPTLAGPFNITAPEPVTNRGFSMALARQRGALLSLPVPGFVMRAAMGELADELLLTGQRVVPRNLQVAGFGFNYPDVSEALPRLLAS
jgi:uncharacterized protein (TIGR01777 family)